MCSIGARGAIENVQIQANLRHYVLERLNADLFFHIDLNVDESAAFKEIHLPPSYMNAFEYESQLRKELRITAFKTASFAREVLPHSRCEEVSGKQEVAVSVSAALPYFDHAISCINMVSEHEGLIGKKYKYVLFINQAANFLPGSSPIDLTIERRNMVFLDLLGNSSLVGGRVILMTRDLACEYAHFPRSLLRANCSTFADMAAFSNLSPHLRSWTERTIAYFWMKHEGVKKKLIWRILRHTYVRRCGDQKLCEKTAEVLCKDGEADNKTCTYYKQPE